MGKNKQLWAHGKDWKNVTLWEEENRGCFYIPLWAFSFLTFLPDDHALRFLFGKEKVTSRDTCGNVGELKQAQELAGVWPGMTPFLCRFPWSCFCSLCCLLSTAPLPLNRFLFVAPQSLPGRRSTSWPCHFNASVLTISEDQVQSCRLGLIRCGPINGGPRSRLLRPIYLWPRGGGETCPFMGLCGPAVTMTDIVLTTVQQNNLNNSGPAYPCGNQIQWRCSLLWSNKLGPYWSLGW